MDLKQLEVSITNLKSKISGKKEESGDLSLARKTKKSLKRAQRRRRVMIKQAKNLATRAKKKEEATS